MRKQATAPTHGWLISNRILRFFAWCFLIIFAVVFIAVWTITYTIRRDCSRPYNRDIKVAGYWLHVDAGSTAAECPQHDD